jgi:hypothetical protein
MFVLPVLGNSGFIPIVSIQLDVFICDTAYSENGDPDYTDSILYRDCNENCWQGYHVVLVGF